ncbi:hypothetical protein P3102_10600 [Amycolatopsis sp. QT-25]|uniref:hypothetical protein n=1 Tax=Amycolatopsis sp. QT-25 TaxID=3034022 RepID=UPI0023EE00B3|nr:hypothetical protein [Amycolatopsis sp. QT-25]WET81623.1 hypothetical protein P3102_10600 [Amycolatopsis sp. QT-25]
MAARVLNVRTRHTGPSPVGRNRVNTGTLLCAVLHLVDHGYEFAGGSDGADPAALHQRDPGLGGAVEVLDRGLHDRGESALDIGLGLQDARDPAQRLAQDGFEFPAEDVELFFGGPGGGLRVCS